MNLPQLPIVMPPADFPIHIPEMMHPLVVHFVVALPFIIILLELINLFAKKRSIGVISFVLLLLLSGIIYAALLTGLADAKAIETTLGADAKALLTQHKLYGVYLFYASILLVIFKLLAVMIRGTATRVLMLILLILFAAGTLATAKRGGELVYRYAAHVHTPAAAPAPVKAPAQKAEPAAASEAEEMKSQAVESSTEKTEAAETVTETTPAAESAPATTTDKALGETPSDKGKNTEKNTSN
ncbi:DUF2231 domain-containing protein [Nitratifractor sp.]|uniref:DUF2231 domain-containing protein n=1 Tax=Nitratifractor sp. TaxID=2268144 RepID=UPI0025F7FCCF|nr:DUF2231 domain-containing protein [Nitratifractor sp.]